MIFSLLSSSPLCFSCIAVKRKKKFTQSYVHTCLAGLNWCNWSVKSHTALVFTSVQNFLEFYFYFFRFSFSCRNILVSMVDFIYSFFLVRQFFVIPALAIFCYNIFCGMIFSLVCQIFVITFF